MFPEYSLRIIVAAFVITFFPFTTVFISVKGPENAKTKNRKWLPISRVAISAGCG
jgi:hypothetical protein